MSSNVVTILQTVIRDTDAIVLIDYYITTKSSLVLGPCGFIVISVFDGVSPNLATVTLLTGEELFFWGFGWG
jgi:hypothetical protein